jgi:hypothetical protein
MRTLLRIIFYYGDVIAHKPNLAENC